MNIEEINKDREKFQSAVMESVEVELAKVGLRVINVNIKDIDDESGEHRIFHDIKPNTGHEAEEVTGSIPVSPTVVPIPSDSTTYVHK